MIHTSMPPRSLLNRLAPLALLLIAWASAHAEQPLSVSLMGSAEVPPVTTSAIGSAQISVRPDHTVSGSIKISGFVATMAHIHEAAAGKNGPPIITLSKTESGSFSVPVGARLTDAQYASYLAGNLYVNVHSARSPNGEIRAQLLASEGTAKPMLIAK